MRAVPVLFRASEARTSGERCTFRHVRRCASAARVVDYILASGPAKQLAEERILNQDKIASSVSKAQVIGGHAGDTWLEQGANLVLFGPSGGGESRLRSAIG